MKSMPYHLKQKMRRCQNLVEKANALNFELVEDLERYGVPLDNLTGTDVENEEVWNESFTHLTYGEGDVESNIKEIEEVFLHFVNKENKQ